MEIHRTIALDFVRIVGRMPTRSEFDDAAGKCRVCFLSADNPDSIRGFGFHGIVLDEAAAVSAPVWNYVLRPTLAQTMGWAVFISTPMGWGAPGCLRDVWDKRDVRYLRDWVWRLECRVVRRARGCFPFSDWQRL